MIGVKMIDGTENIKMISGGYVSLFLIGYNRTKNKEK
jgi:hypothetical protein